ncbi:ABC transporter permease [Jiangella anatolica]|uniref:ABC transporter permease n=1 Tax=Jiangella anatolica TaxID=2670374 RepID=A0A2W2AX00_9ACTN|nr:ABC transporter permease [Jiangella anatolica]PZF79675.1 ABC transporter permease [Jiangella anatolica]
MTALVMTGSLRRVRSLATAEVRLLVRNRTAMFTALGLPVFTVLLLSTVGLGEDTGLPLGAMVLTMLAGFTLLYVVYYNLVSAYVARREELVLKRLRVGELRDAEILAGTALPSVLVALAQVLLTAVVAALVFELDPPPNVLLAVAAVLAGLVLFVLLAAASTAITRNVEMAQVSTLPMLFLGMGSLLLSGVAMPADSLPDGVRTALQFVPLTPIVDLIQLGLTGRTPDGDTVGFAASWAEAAVPLAITVAWLAIGVWALRRWFRWEPRG